jgi:diguanylate cyclase (GGDEF)-like protein
MTPAHMPALPAHDQLDALQERQTMGRVSAGVWAAIAFFGALATIKPLRFPDTDVSSMRVVVLSAVTIAAVTLALPWKRMPSGLLKVVLVLMSVHISALAYASGAIQNELVMVLTLAIVLAAAFLPLRTGAAEVVFIAILLAAGLLLVAKNDVQIEALRTTLLFAVLVVLCGLVLIMRAVMTERTARIRDHDFHSGMIDSRELNQQLDREISRAARHARPLAVVLMDVSGSVAEGADRPEIDRTTTMLARSILGRIRVEDTAAYLGQLRFAIVAPETTAAGAASIAETVSDVVRRRLVTLGYDTASFEIAVGWADYPHHARSRSELLEAAAADLKTAVLHNETAPARGGRAPAASVSGPATARPG